MSFREWIIPRTGTQTMLYLTCTSPISGVDLERYGVSHAKGLGICSLWYKQFGMPLWIDCPFMIVLVILYIFIYFRWQVD